MYTPKLTHSPLLTHPAPAGELGVRLSKDLTAVAASALQKNMVLLGPLVLPFSEKFLFAINLIRRKLLGNKKLPPYTPDFSLAFEHICIHSGERMGHAADSC